MSSLLIHSRERSARTAPQGRTHVRRLVLRTVVLLLLAALLAAPAERGIASASRNTSAPVKAANVGGGGLPDIATLDFAGTGGGGPMMWESEAQRLIFSKTTS